MFCVHCGNKISEKSVYCSGCGKQIKEPKEQKPKKGKSIASMVLGIISITWAFLELLSLENIPSLVNQFYSISQLVGGFIGYNLFSLPTAIVGLVLGVQSKEKSKKRMSGIIMTSISLCVCLISLIVMIINFI